MTAATLHHLTIDVLENQRRAAKTMLAAMRQGYARAYGRLDSAWEKGLESGLAARMNGEFKSSLLSVEKKVSGAAMNGVDTMASFIDTRVDRAYDLATDGLRSDRARKLYDTRAYGFVSQASLPLAKLSAKVSAGVADGVEKLAERVLPADGVVDVAAATKKVAKVAKTVKARSVKATVAPRRAVRKVVAKGRRAAVV